MKRKFIGGVILALFLIIANQFFIQYALYTKRLDSSLINLAGRQRMLSQKIALECYQVGENRSALHALQKDIKDWKKAHYQLLADSQEMSKSIFIKIRQKEIIGRLNRLSERIRFIEREFEGYKQTGSFHTQQIAQNQQAFLEQMDLLVSKLVMYSDKKLLTIIILEIILALFFMAIIILEVRYIYYPQAKSLKNLMAELLVKERSLGKNKILIKVIEELDEYAFLLLDLNGTIQSWNPGAKKIKGYSSNEIVGQNFRCFYTEEDLKTQKPDRLLKEAIEKGKVHDEGWRLRKDHTTFWGSVTITAIHDEGGQVIGFGKLTKDLTDQKNAEQALRIDIKNKELEKKEIEQFNYIASHDLQEPLRTVSNYIQILEEDFFDQLNDEARSYLQTIKQAASRMTILVRSLLDYSRLGMNRKLILIDCNKLMRDVLSDLHNTIKTSGADITVLELPTMKAYEIELRQLFQNLINNAIKFRNKNVRPEIKIGYRNVEGFVEFFVSDNGIGIDPKYFSKIFYIFQRLNSEKEFEGHGIGLANCKKIVEMHGGEIWIESEPQKGTTFKFTISNV